MTENSLQEEFASRFAGWDAFPNPDQYGGFFIDDIRYAQKHSAGGEDVEDLENRATRLIKAAPDLYLVARKIARWIGRAELGSFDQFEEAVGEDFPTEELWDALFAAEEQKMLCDDDEPTWGDIAFIESMWKPRMIKVAETMQEYLQEEFADTPHAVLPVHEMSAEVATYSFIVTKPPEKLTTGQDVYAIHDNDVDVSISMPLQKVHEEGGWGASFRTDVYSCGGEIIGGISPGNYTSDVWVDMRDKHSLQRRFEDLEENCLVGLYECIRDFFAKKEEERNES